VSARIFKPGSRIDKTGGAVLLLLALFLRLAEGSDTVCSNYLVRVIPVRELHTVHFYLENQQLAPVTVTLTMLSWANMTSSVAFPFIHTVGGKKRVKAFTIWARDVRQSWNYRYSNSVTFGSLHATHDPAFVYRLPYLPGRGHRVVQGYNGKFSHTGNDLYALDLSLPKGSTVCAARAGTVVAFKSNSDVGGPRRGLANCANFIMIEHHDGTLAEYSHLKQDGVQVKVGDVVKAGDTLGLSGATGYASGPHLHFAVFKAKNGVERETFPTRFATKEAESVLLEEGKRYSVRTPH
jgi:murein DD-endopeptidase MepM/ murein hydrolase activator NlpD